MKTSRKWLWWLALAAAAPAMAAQGPGERLPPLEARDVTGAPQRLQELVARGPTLLVAVTDQHAVDGMRAWFTAADRQAPTNLNRVSIVSLGLPFFVGDKDARNRARKQVPPIYWHSSLMDKGHEMSKTLGLNNDRLPYAFALAPDGKVLAVVHGSPDVPGATAVWRVLSQNSK